LDLAVTLSCKVRRRAWRIAAKHISLCSYRVASGLDARFDAAAKSLLLLWGVAILDQKGRIKVPLPSVCPLQKRRLLL
jgi:hypothetical protein